MLAALAALTILTILPAEPTPRASCVVVAQEQLASAPTIPAGVRYGIARTGQNIAAAGTEYVLCEAEAGNVVEVLFTEGGAAVATMRDGKQYEFAVSSSKGAWVASTLSARGVKIHSSETLKIEASETGLDSGAAPGPNPWGILVLLMSGIAVAVLALRWRKRRPGRVAVQGVTSEARLKRTDIPDTRFSDVAGCREAIDDLQEIVSVLKHPERYAAVGARAPKGALLTGPPGTGKTLLARAVAGEAGVPFFSAAGSDFVEMYVGVGARRVRDMFEKARKAGSAIVFIDEIDAVGRKRSQTAASGGEGETENTLISLLNELDGFRDSNVVVLAATNRADVLDPALLRPGRLDRRVHVGLPDVAGREEILAIHMRNKPAASGVDLSTVARRTPGMSGAQLEQVCNEAALFAAQADRTQIIESDLAGAVEYVVMGRARRSAKVHPQDRLVTAWHEAGHALCALRQPAAERPVAISIIPRGEAGGVTWMTGSDSQLMSRSQLKARLVVALGGRVAEEMLLDGEHTAGAANDLEQASAIAGMMVDHFGMTDRGLTVRTGSTDSSDTAVEALLQSALADARALLAQNLPLLHALVDALLENDDLSEHDIARIDQQHA